MERSVELFIATMALVVALPASVWANMADPAHPGDRPGEIAGEVGELRVERERLVFDLSDLTRKQQGRIEATYHVANDEPSRTLELQFVALGFLGGVDDFEVELDGVPLEARLERDAELPEHWQWSNDQETQSEGGAERETGASLLFDVELSKGLHEIRVSYPVDPNINRSFSNDPHFNRTQLGRYNEYAFRYLLAPLYEWGEVGNVEIVVRPPNGDWELRTKPTLEQRDDGTLAKTFEDLDARTFDIEAAPQLFYGWREVAAFVAAVLAFFACTVLGPLLLGGVRRRLGANEADSRLARLLVFLLFGLAYLVVLLVSVPLFWVVLSFFERSAHIHPRWSYIVLFSSVLMYPVALFVFVASSGWAAARS